MLPESSIDCGCVKDEGILRRVILERFQLLLSGDSIYYRDKAQYRHHLLEVCVNSVIETGLVNTDI